MKPKLKETIFIFEGYDVSFDENEKKYTVHKQSDCTIIASGDYTSRQGVNKTNATDILIRSLKQKSNG